jgi:hypothetical protein
VLLDHARAILAAVDRAVDATRGQHELAPAPKAPKSPGPADA